MDSIQCKRCLHTYPYIEVIHLTSGDKTERICFTCHNQELAEDLGIDLKSVTAKVLTIADVDGVEHQFHIRQGVYPTGLAYEAIEVLENDVFGYHFAVLGNFDCDQKALYKELLKKIRTGLSKKYLKQEVLGGRQITSTTGWDIVGRIEADLAEDAMPQVVIDGKVYSWNELGRIITSHEGLNFRLAFKDMTEDIDE